MKLRVVLLMFCLALCAPWAPAQAPAGRAVTPGPFDTIEISGSAVVQVSQGASDQVVIEGGSDAQDTVGLEVHDRVLTIRPSGAWKFWSDRRVRIAVTVRDLTRLIISGAADVRAPGSVRATQLAVSISGAGSVRFDQLQADELKFTVSGAGDGQMAGAVDQLSVSISGRSEFRGKNLMSRRAAVAVSGVGDVQVWATETLKIAVSGLGTVDYWGTPSVRRSTSGVATINARGAKRAGS
jgi:putative autotransporter adhesin-like protein